MTVQNKTTPSHARATVDLLEREFVPWSATATGLALRAYAGGPWQPLARFPFS